ncbi:hypothetical protein GGS23DRAFT_599162 [Durotheca rogersii]|uniref:uncharacterized protein n=1 Tax=Durotheca rogersii TaxID=419775 RepID=UPI00221E688B|nr:uncharacterized protein GGS23DRAFT_599162 [Durotheca rogersii]KAI5860639.1 hypothetical protein GGS23DRAFT_599162 [Durotheca rogersii]
MRFASIAVGAAALLAAGTDAAVLRRDGPRLAQIRAFGAEGCHNLNYGFYTIDQSDANTCHTFVGLPEGAVANSVKLEAVYSPAANGCTSVLPAGA